MEQKTVLVVEDSIADAELVRRMLMASDGEFAVSSAVRLSTASGLLESKSFDAVIIDLNLPDSTGLDTLRKIQEKASHSAIVVLASYADENAGVDAVEVGAQDYLVKDHLKSDVIHRVVRYAIGRKQVQVRLQKSEELSEARNRINDLISSTLDFEEILNRVIGEAAKSIGAEAALIGRYDEGGFTVRCNYGPLVGLKDLVLPQEEFRAFATLEKNGIPIISVDAQTDERINSEVAKRYGVHAALFFPLFVNGSVTGALACFNLSVRFFDDIEVDSARKISASLSLALENAQLYKECRVAEDNLRKKSIELEKKSSELELSNRELEQFASVASHDLQEPLISFASEIKLSLIRLKGKADEEALRYLSNALTNAVNMQKMVRNLLAYSHVGRHPSFESTDLEKVLELAINNLRYFIEESGAVVTHDPLPRLFVDPILVSRLFQNLVGNAIKYRSGRPPEVHITVDYRDGEHIFCVKDNGMGMPVDYADTVFQLFRRIPGVNRTLGSGIGLATCKKIVELHGGRIWVESAEGKGSSFFFVLPAAMK